ncbi:MAG: hypothetical protein M4579_001495 [Chaenotheca gracillima]|nr:MAG: hypothetical protein M4579_001495 [Chaenotheca gracillima]
MAQAGSDAAAQERIIKHMNADHKESLRRYLEFYCKIPSSIARNAQLAEFTLDHMIITSTGTRNIIPFDPPLSGWSEARPRVVKMDQAAIVGLGRSDITVKEYAPLRIVDIMVVIGVLTGVTLTARRATLYPGTFIYDNILHHLPGLVAFLRNWRSQIFYSIVGIHIAEAFYFERSRLVKYNVPRLSRLWWTWLVSNLFEGFGAFRRFDALVRKEQKAKDQAKH